jgi:hypothetical protein
MSQFHEDYLSAYLDDTLDSATKREVEHRLGTDTLLEAEYRSLQAVKVLFTIRQERLRLPAPVEVRRSVLLKLEQELVRSASLASIQEDSSLQEELFPPSSKKEPAFQQSAFQQSAFQPSTQRATVYNLPALTKNMWEQRHYLVAAVVVFALGFGAMRFLVRNAQTPPANQTSVHTTPNTATDLVEAPLVHDALRNFNAVTSGKISLQYATHSFDDLDQFFRNNGVAFHLVRPRIANTTLLGGVVSEENGKKSAHLVFTHDTTLVYMWEIEETPATIRHAAIKPEAWQILQTGEWLWNTSNDATVVFWEDETEKSHRTLCAVVSAMPRADLQPLFQ